MQPVYVSLFEEQDMVYINLGSWQRSGIVFQQMAPSTLSSTDRETESTEAGRAREYAEVAACDFYFYMNTLSRVG